MSKDTLESIAYENGLQYITTTAASNGYPQNLRGAIIGFSTFNEAKALAEKHNLRITTFYKKDGWQFYTRNGDTTWSPLHITASDYGDDYSRFETSDRRYFFENEVKPFLEDMESFDDLRKFVSQKEKIFEKLENIDDGQFVITYRGAYYETIDRELMEWSNDSQTWVIGVIDD